MTHTLQRTVRLLPALSLAALAAVGTAGCESSNHKTAYNPKVLDLRSAPLARGNRSAKMQPAMAAIDTTPKGPVATGATSKSGFPEMVFASPGFGALPGGAAPSEAPVVVPAEAEQPMPAAMPTAAPVAAASAAGPRTHVVQRGETLYSLAQAFYGSGKQWQTIADANPGVTPSRMPVGQTLMIP